MAVMMAVIVAMVVMMAVIVAMAVMMAVTVAMVVMVLGEQLPGRFRKRCGPRGEGSAGIGR